MYMRVQESEGKKIVAVCDEELLDRVFEEGEMTLDLKTYSSFYKGRKVTREEVREEMKDADSINLVGKKAVGLALELNIASKEEVIRIAGIPHLQIYRL